eukprot:6160553-Karenia_brevis.AAC.1
MKNECTNWIVQCRDYLKKRKYSYNKARVRTQSGEDRYLHWCAHADQNNPGFTRRQNRVIWEQHIYYEKI